MQTLYALFSYGFSKNYMSTLRRISLGMLSLLFIAAGIMHFAVPETYVSIIPPFIPYPLWMVYISGIAEILGGLLLWPRITRRPAAIGLILLLMAVFPANIYQAFTPALHEGMGWFWYLRLPLQVPLIYWAWTFARQPNR